MATPTTITATNIADAASMASDGSHRRLTDLAVPVSGTATATSGAATLSALAGKVTSEALTTAAGAVYTLTLTNTLVAAADMVFASVSVGAGTGQPIVASVIPAAGSCVIRVMNNHASAAFNAAIVISFSVQKARS